MNDKALLNGKIFTADDNRQFAEAVLISGSKIKAVGTNEEIKSLINNDTLSIDLKGKLLLPGFIDNHVHLVWGGEYLNGVNLRPANSMMEFQDILQDFVLKHKGEWITGGSWDHEHWDEKKLPSKELIDSFTPDTPIFVTRIDLHMGLANSYALKLAGINKDTPNPPGGFIQKDALSGEPTGILKDNAITLLNKFIPTPSHEIKRKNILTAINHLKKNGFTSVHDISQVDDFNFYRELEVEGNLNLRIYSRYPLTKYHNLKEKYESDLLQQRSLKAFADGSLGSYTAWFYDDYEGQPGNKGLPTDVVLDGSLKSYALKADKDKFQLSIHAIGDKANRYVLDIYEEIVNNNPEWDRRFRIEHVQHLSKSDYSLMGKINVIASVQPYHCIDDGSWAEKLIGKKRLNEIYSFKSMIDSGIKVCFGSDWTVAPVSPLQGIYAAVTRRTFDNKNPDGWIPNEKISVEEAIKCYTINNAYASFMDDKTGSITEGKFADMVVLDKDILSIPTEEIINAKPVMRIFSGNIEEITS